MGVIVPVGEVQVALRWLGAGDAEEMVTLLGFNGRGPYADASALASSVAAATATTLCPAATMGTGWSFVGATAYIKQDDGDSEVGESSTVVAGTGNFQTVPSNTAVLVRKRTASSGRDAQGRHYFPPFMFGEQTINNNGVLDPAVRTAFQTRINDWYSALQTAFDPDQMCLFHSDGSPSDPVTALIVDAQVATQRTRMRR